MGKIYKIPLDKGYARGRDDNDGADIPEGFWTGWNMAYREDGALIGRYSYKKLVTGQVGSSYNIIRSLFVLPTGDSIAIASNGYPYYNVSGQNTWNLCTWDQQGSAPVISSSHPGKWGWINAQPVYSNGYNIPIIFSQSGQSYQDINSGGFKAYIPIEHQNRLMLAALTSNQAMIRYSNVGDPQSGYTENYVNVGDSMEAILGAHYMSGNLVLLKRYSVWAKIGLYSQLTSNQFQPVYQGINPVGGSIVSRNIFYFADTSGVLAYTSGNLTNLSELFNREWKMRQNTPSGIENVLMGYWYDRDWLLVTTGTGCEQTWVYETQKGRWLKFTDLNISCCVQHTQADGGLSFGRYDSQGEPYVYVLGYSLNDTQEEDAISQVLRTPYLDLGNPYTEKVLRRIFLYAENVDSVDIYFQDHPGDFPQQSSLTIDSPEDGEVINPGPLKSFKAISLKLAGSGRMVVKSIALEFEERRI